MTAVTTFDLSPERDLTPAVALLHATVKDAYRRLKRLLEDVTEEEARYRGPDGSLNSIGALVRHLALVDLRWAFRIKGEPIPDAFLASYGPFRAADGRLPEGGDTLQNLLLKYDRVQQIFRDACLSLQDSDLERRVQIRDDLEATLRWGIWHVADHSLYHQGHMQWLVNWARANPSP